MLVWYLKNLCGVLVVKADNFLFTRNTSILSLVCSTGSYTSSKAYKSLFCW